MQIDTSRRFLTSLSVCLAVLRGGNPGGFLRLLRCYEKRYFGMSNTSAAVLLSEATFLSVCVSTCTYILLVPVHVLLVNQSLMIQMVQLPSISTFRL